METLASIIRKGNKRHTEQKGKDKTNSPYLQMIYFYGKPQVIYNEITKCYYKSLPES